MVQERQNNQAALSDGTQLARMFAGHLPIGVFVAKISGENTFLNRWLAQKLEISETNFTGNPLFDLIHHYDREPVRRAWVNFWRHRRPFALECRAVTRSGVDYFFRCKAEQFANAAGLTRAIGIIEDITAEKQSSMQMDRLSLGLFIRSELVREETARELHATIGQNLALMKLQVQSQSGKNFEAGKCIDLLNEAIAGADSLAQKLSPLTLSMLGLSVAITDLIDGVVRKQGKRFYADVSLAGLDEAVPKYYAIQVYRIVQEIVNAIVKHSDATKIILSTGSSDEGFFLFISDNGQWPRGSNRRRDSVGLRVIAERARLIGASLTFSEDRCGGGVRITIA